MAKRTWRRSWHPSGRIGVTTRVGQVGSVADSGGLSMAVGERADRHGAGGRYWENPTPATAQLSTVRPACPAIRASVLYRVAVVAGSSAAIRSAGHP
jgi:hypothetical protein